MRLILILTALLTFQATNALEIDELLLKGEEGDGLTQYLLGRIYAEGVVGIERNKDVSESWYSKALATFEANQSQLDPKEQRSLAYIYGLELGGAKQNPSKVFDLLTSSARQNHMPSQLDLVSLYLGSSLAPRDISKAKFWALEIIKKRQEFAKEATLLMFQGYFQRIAWAYNQEDRILAGSYLSNFFGSSSPVFGAIALTRKSSSPFLPAILALVKEQVELQSRECRTQQLPDLYAEALMWMLIAHSLDAADTKYVSAFKDALSSSQITEGERLARLCIDSNFEMCGYETEANLIDYEIVSDIFAKDEKWIVSECFSKNKIFTRKLTNSSGYILQDFHEGLIDQEIGWLFDGTAQELRKFYQGLITDQVLQRKNLTRHRTFSVGTPRRY